jgi:exopolysaccharide biosynthesis WecB/TagA/CpsF family protein
MVQSESAVRWPVKVDMFGVGVSVTSYQQATDVIFKAIEEGQPAIVACQAVHAVITATRDPILLAKMNSFNLVTPDGQPVRWAMNLLHRAGLADRVYGPQLMLHLCARAAQEGVAIYLYGGSEEVIARLRTNLTRRWPALRIAGAESPPFRSLTPDEDRAVVERINGSGARLLFIGLGCPKQDHFAHEHRDCLRAVQVCVGAAFDFHAGVKRIAPAWMQRHGLEWLHRLLQEPGRLWRRYLFTNSLFLARVGAALLEGSYRKQRAWSHEK